MTNGIFSAFSQAARTASAAVRQCPISNRFAIHNHVIIVSDRNRAAIRAFLMSSFGRCFKFSSIQPTARNISFSNRCVFWTVRFLQLNEICIHAHNCRSSERY